MPVTYLCHKVFIKAINSLEKLNVLNGSFQTGLLLDITRFLENNVNGLLAKKRRWSRFNTHTQICLFK